MADQEGAGQRRQDLRDRLERLIEPEHRALLVALYGAADLAGDRRAQYAVAEAGEKPRNRDPEWTVDERIRQVAHDAGREAVEHQTPLAKAAHEGAKQEALQNDPDQTEVGERIADLLGIERLSGVGEAAFGKEREAIDVGRKSDVEDKNLHQQTAQARRHKVLAINAEREEASRADLGSGLRGGPHFAARKQRGTADDATERKEGRGEDRRLGAELEEEGREARAHEETDPEGHGDLAECGRAFFGAGYVGNIGLSQRNVAGGEAVDDAGKKDQRQRVCEGEQQKSQAGANLAHDQEGLAAHVVAPAAEQRSRNKLAERVDRDQHSHHEGGCSKLLRVEGEQRENDHQAEHVDQHDKEDGKNLPGLVGGGHYADDFGLRRLIHRFHPANSFDDNHHQYWI